MSATLAAVFGYLIGYFVARNIYRGMAVRNFEAGVRIGKLESIQDAAKAKAAGSDVAR